MATQLLLSNFHLPSRDNVPTLLTLAYPETPGAWRVGAGRMNPGRGARKFAERGKPDATFSLYLPRPVSWSGKMEVALFGSPHATTTAGRETSLLGR